MDIRFPKDKDTSIVVIQGLEENVEDAKEHLITLAEDYVRFYIKVLLCILILEGQVVMAAVPLCMHMQSYCSTTYGTCVIVTLFTHAHTHLSHTHTHLSLSLTHTPSHGI